MVNNPPFNAGNVGSILGQGIKVPHAMGQLSPCATTIDPARLNQRACVPQLQSPRMPQLQSPRALEPVPHN